MRWWFWYVDTGQWVVIGPEYLSTYDAFILQERTRMHHPMAIFYRWLWDADNRQWLYDGRSNPQFLASA